MTTNKEQNTDWQLERKEWIAAFQEIIEERGEQDAADLMKLLRSYAIRKGVRITGEALNTPYINTINARHQPAYPGDTALEIKIENINRWNAMAMVLQAYDSGAGLGGHIATYASAASMYEVGFNHFFKRSQQNMEET